MRITFNGKIDSKSVQIMLTEQEIKKQNIIEFCKKNKINEMHYKDSELEFDYVADNGNKSKVETRPKQVNKEVR